MCPLNYVSLSQEKGQKIPVALSCQCSVVWKLQTQTPALKYKGNVSTDLTQWGPNVLDQLCSHCNLCLLYCPTNWTKNNKTEKILSLSEDTINRADFDFFPDNVKNVLFMMWEFVCFRFHSMSLMHHDEPLRCSALLQLRTLNVFLSCSLPGLMLILVMSCAGGSGIGGMVVFIFSRNYHLYVEEKKSWTCTSSFKTS